jgi:glycosyltransferase involved in cell wall biosynthesis
MNYKKVLLITHEYPPIGGPASIRYMQFSKYLPNYGWKPIVLTVKNPSFLIKKDKSLKVPRNTKIYRSITIPTFTLYKALSYFIGNKASDAIFFPDPYIGWILNTIIKGYQIIRKEKIDLILVGCSPNSSAIIGYILKKLTKKPFIIDFRDPYAGNPSNDYFSGIHKYIDKKLEQRIIQSLDSAITVTESFIKYFPYKEKFTVIPNGYFDLVLNKEKPTEKYEEFTISTIGAIYSGELWINFLRALKIFQKKSNLKIRVLFIGYGSQRLLEPIAKKLNLADIIQYTGFIPNEECNMVLEKSHLLVINLPAHKNSALVVKIFSMIHSDSPILGIMDQSSETANFILKSKTGIVVKNTMQDILEGLMELIDAKFDRNWQYIQLFDRKNLTAKFAEVFNKVIEKTKKN